MEKWNTKVYNQPRRFDESRTMHSDEGLNLHTPFSLRGGKVRDPGNEVDSISDQRQISLCSINAFSVREVMRIKDMITQHDFRW